MYDIEKYYQAVSVPDAVRALSEDEKAVVISGGSDVLIQIREGRLAGCSLVSIRGIPELDGIERTADGEVIIRAATVFSHIANNPIILETMSVGYDLAGIRTEKLDRFIEGLKDAAQTPVWQDRKSVV